MKKTAQYLQSKTLVLLVILLFGSFIFTNMTPVLSNDNFSQTIIKIPSVIHNSSRVTFYIIPKYDNGSNANVPVQIKVNETVNHETSPFGYGTFVKIDNNQESPANETILMLPDENGTVKIDYIAPSVQEDITLNTYVIINNTIINVKQITISPNIATDLSRSTMTPSTQITASSGVVEINVKADTAQQASLPTVQLIMSADSGTFDLNGVQDTTINLLLEPPDHQVNIKWIAPLVNSETIVKINATFTLYDYYQQTIIQEITVLPPDFTSSTIELNSSITKPNDFVKATVTVLNGQTPVGGIRVEFYSNGGEFTTNTTVYSNDQGKAETIWKAPNVIKTTTFWINATVFGANGQVITLSKTLITTATTYNITVITNSTNILKGETVEINILLTLDGIPAPNIPLTIEADQGHFLNGQQIVAGNTNDQGSFTVYWKADFNPLPISGSDVLFVIKVDDGVLAPTSKEFTIHVNPITPDYKIITKVNPSKIYVNQTTNIIIQVLNGTHPVVNATVRIETGSGEFKEGLENNPQVAYAVTNSSGYAVFNWEPKGLLNPPEPRIVNFNIQVSIITEVPVSISTTTNVTVIPFGWNENTNTNQQTNGTENSQNNNIGRLMQNNQTAAIIIAIIVVASGGTAVIYLIKKRG